MSRAYRRDAGAAFIETIVAIVLLGVTIVSIVGGQGVAVLIAASDRERSEAAAVVANVSAALRDPAASPFDPCDGESPVLRPSPTVRLRDGWSVATTYAWWDGDGFGSECPADPALRGVQLVTIEVVDARGSVTTHEVVKVP